MNLSKIVLFSSSAISWPDEFQLLHFEERIKRQHFRNFLLLAARMSFNVYDVLEMVILDRLASQGMLTVLHTTFEALLKYMVLNFFYEDRGFNLVQAGLYIQRSELML